MENLIEKNPRYMIHAVPARMWYVNDYLIPSMLEQGIKREQIAVYNDVNKEGNLKACMHAFQAVDSSVEGTWHLQDDVIISHDFKEKTEQHNQGMVCGFKSKYDGDLPASEVDIKQMWFSFPCIRIPNKIAIECADWVLNYIIGNVIYKDWWKDGVNDDMLFKKFLQQHYKNISVLNLAPNIVDHVDYLLGGSVNGKRKTKTRVMIRSLCWEDEYLVDELSKKLLKEE